MHILFSLLRIMDLYMFRTPDRGADHAAPPSAEFENE
jgi:hypothetical protein